MQGLKFVKMAQSGLSASRLAVVVKMFIQELYCVVNSRISFHYLRSNTVWNLKCRKHFLKIKSCSKNTNAKTPIEFADSNFEQWL